MSEHIDNTLREATPIQSKDAYERVFGRVMERLEVVPVPSPYQAFFQRRLVTQTVAALLVVVVAMGGTVAVADAAKPGDWLFPVEQVSESARLLITPTAKKPALESRFLEERIAELETIIDSESPYVASTSETNLLKQASEARIANAIETAVVQAKRIDEKDRPERLSQLLAVVNRVRSGKRTEFVTEMSRVRIEPERMEIRNEHERIRVEKKDQEVRMRYEWRDDRDKQESRSRSHGSSDDRQQKDATKSDSSAQEDDAENWHDWFSGDENEDDDDDRYEDATRHSGRHGDQSDEDTHRDEDNDDDSDYHDEDKDDSNHGSDDDTEEDD